MGVGGVRLVISDSEGTARIAPLLVMVLMARYCYQAGSRRRRSSAC